MAWLLCLGCMSLLRAKRGHLCRARYPRAGPHSPGVARIGVLNMLCIGKLWPKERPWAMWRET